MPVKHGHRHCLLSKMASEGCEVPRRVRLDPIPLAEATVYLFNGIMAAVERGRQRKSHSICCYDTEPCLWFIYQLEGVTRVKAHSQEFDLKSGEMMVVTGTEVNRELRSCEGRNFGCAYIRLNQAFLQRHFRQDDAGQSRAIRRFVENGQGHFCVHSETTSAGAKLALRQLCNSPYDAPLEMLFAESRTLDIVCDSLSLIIEDATDKGEIPLSGQDVEKIHYARELLLQDLTASPPSIKGLATKVGINEFKLKKGFRFLFKTSIYNCHRNARMDLARNLLTQGQLNVCEVACAVGYSNPSHFCRAFHNLFSINPGAYLREVRNKGFHVAAATSRTNPGRLFS